ncbi:MAG: hypothetical protein ACI87E_002871 [Mariniblastus sp.]|jgi:hypothetical protein
MDAEKQPSFEELISGSARALTSIGPLLPTEQTVESTLKNVACALERGYFLPDEDDQIRRLFSSYLTTRAALQSVLEDLREPVLEEFKRSSPQTPEAFLIAFCTACMLVRTARHMVDNFRSNKTIWRKLDEAEPRYGIPRGQFTKIFRSVTSAPNIMRFMEGIKYYQKHKRVVDALESNPTLQPVIKLLRQEEPFVESSFNYYARQIAKYRWHSLLRRPRSGFKKVTFGLFQISGSLVSELRMKWKRKRVTPGVQRKLARLLEPGDVIITRHDDAASNLFLPGFWPHGALYIGTEEQRKQLDPTGATWQRIECAPPNCVLEARKDGVLFRPLHDTLAVDSCVVIRPKLKPEDIRDAIAQAMTHHGKSYDFEFDFRRTDKLVCTEVIYRAYHGIADIAFELKARTGRVCLSAEDLLDHAVEGQFFELVALYGFRGNRFLTGERAMTSLGESYRKNS